MTEKPSNLPVLRIERGWGGHFICANRCRFRRNTLLVAGETKIVVSTVGLMESLNGKTFETIGYNRYFETLAFHARFDGRYWDADVNREVEFESPWCISEIDADDKANDQHEAVVIELTAKLLRGKDSNHAMTSIQEAQQARTALEQKIADALHQFSAETGLVVTYVNVDYGTILGRAPNYLVQVEAKL